MVIKKKQIPRTFVGIKSRKNGIACLLSSQFHAWMNRFKAISFDFSATNQTNWIERTKNSLPIRIQWNTNSYISIFFQKLTQFCVPKCWIHRATIEFSSHFFNKSSQKNVFAHPFSHRIILLFQSTWVSVTCKHALGWTPFDQIGWREIMLSWKKNFFYFFSSSKRCIFLKSITPQSLRTYDIFQGNSIKIIWKRSNGITDFRCWNTRMQSARTISTRKESKVLRKLI